MGTMRVPCVKSTIAEVHAMVPLALSHNTLQESSSLSRIFQHSYGFWCKAGVSPRASEPWNPIGFNLEPISPKFVVTNKKNTMFPRCLNGGFSVY
jgi:hypothetical protein